MTETTKGAFVPLWPPFFYQTWGLQHWPHVRSSQLLSNPSERVKLAIESIEIFIQNGHIGRGTKRPSKFPITACLQSPFSRLYPLNFSLLPNGVKLETRLLIQRTTGDTRHKQWWLDGKVVLFLSFSGTIILFSTIALHIFMPTNSINSI